jgi:hypothetical protein
MLKGGGPLSLLRGWGAVLCRNIPQSVIKFTVFEQLQARVTDAHDSGEQRTVKSLACGAAAATTGACVTTPIDVIKTRIQTQGQTRSFPCEASQHIRLQALSSTGKKARKLIVYLHVCVCVCVCMCVCLCVCVCVCVCVAGVQGRWEARLTLFA